MLVSHTIPSLVGGVSQQPPQIRFSSQHTEQVNAYSSLVDGLRRRSPFRLLAKLSDAQLTGSYAHTISRDAAEKYTVIFTSTSVLAFNVVTGLSVPVVLSGSSAAYLAAAVNPIEDLRAVTVADHTYVTNRRVTVQQSSDVTPSRPYEALVYVRAGNYGKTYSISSAYFNASYTTPNGDNASQAPYVSTTHIASQLASQLQTFSGVGVSNLGSVLHVTYSADFTVTSEDGQGGNGMKVIKGSVQRFTDLPQKAPVGFVARIEGDPEEGGDAFFVRYEGEHAWRETVRPAVRCALMRETMPHVLVRRTDGVFEMQPVTWDQRAAGDDESNPFPSFVGSTIRDVCFFKNRLGFATGEGIALSRSADFYNFFRTTVATLLDDDPIDVGVNHVRVALIDHTLPFLDRLVLFSGQTQFEVVSDGPLTPQSVVIRPTTETECDGRCRPIGSGTSVFFPFSDGRFTGIREYAVQGDTRISGAALITGHVPRYITQRIVQMAADATESVVLLLGESRNTLYVYQHYTAGAEKVQSAWSRWTVDGGSILSVSADNGIVYCIVQRTEGVFLEALTLKGEQGVHLTAFDIHLDHRFDQSKCTVAYSSALNKTLYTPPISTAGLVVIRKSNGEIVPWTLESGMVALSGNTTGMDVWLGVPYTTGITLTPPVLQPKEGQPPVDAKIQVRNYTLTYRDTLAFSVVVNPRPGTSYSYPMTGIQVGVTPVGGFTPLTGDFRFPVMGNNEQTLITVSTASHLPFALQSARWEGLVIARSRAL